MGERFTVLPRFKADVNGRSSTDPKRFSFLFTGVYEDTAVTTTSQGRMHGHEKNSAEFVVTGARPSIECAIAALIYMPVIDDYIRRETTQELFRIIEPVNSDMDRVLITMARVNK